MCYRASHYISDSDFAWPSEETYSVVRTANILMILLFNTFAYARIFLSVRHMRFFGEKIGDSSTEQISNLKRKTLREQKLAKSCALVVAVNYLCYLPSVVSYLHFKDDLLNYRAFHSWSITIYALNSSLNSVIFAIHHCIPSLLALFYDCVVLTTACPLSISYSACCSPASNYSLYILITYYILYHVCCSYVPLTV